MPAMRQEVVHNTPEQVRLYLEAALELVAFLEPPDDLRETCFAKAVDLLAAKTIQLEQVQPVAGLDGLLGRR